MKEGKRPWSFRGNFRVAGAESLRGVVGRERGLARRKVDWGFRESGMVFALAMLSPKIKDLKYTFTAADLRFVEDPASYATLWHH